VPNVKLSVLKKPGWVESPRRRRTRWRTSTGRKPGLTADGDLEVVGAEAGIEDVDLAAGLADVVHEVGELDALVG